MEVLHKNLDISRFYNDLEATDQRILMLDYDGTLAPFVTERDKAAPYPGVRQILRDLMNESPTRVVIISGRSVAALTRLLGLEHPPELWGSHGFERQLSTGEMVTPDLPERSRAMLDEIATWAEATFDNARTEPKPAGYAFHWRGLDVQASRNLRQTVQNQWCDSLPDAGLSMHEFDGGLEIRLQHIDKGHAVRSLLADAANDSMVAYLGDDLTDEDAFAALETMGRRGLSVLVREQLRPTIAKAWLRPPDELLGFMRRWL